LSTHRPLSPFTTFLVDEALSSIFPNNVEKSQASPAIGVKSEPFLEDLPLKVDANIRKKKKLEKRATRGSQPHITNYIDHFLEMFDSICWTLVGLYVCFVFQFLMVLVFHVTFIARSLTSDIDFLIKPVIFPGGFPLTLLSNLGTRFLLGGRL
jgi:hypothetical protein